MLHCKTSCRKCEKAFIEVTAEPMLTSLESPFRKISMTATGAKTQLRLMPGRTSKKPDS